MTTALHPAPVDEAPVQPFDGGHDDRASWSALFSDTLVFARRNLEHIRQIPEKLLDVTIQPLMAEGGYVCSTPDPTDGRAKRLALDDRGRRALRRARALHASYERRLVRRLGVQRVADLREALGLVGESGDVDAASRVFRPM